MAAGPSGLRIQHLIDAAEVPLQTPVLHSLRAVINTILRKSRSVSGGSKLCSQRHPSNCSWRILALPNRMNYASCDVQMHHVVSRCTMRCPDAPCGVQIQHHVVMQHHVVPRCTMWCPDAPCGAQMHHVVS
ncbi:hypothetical protein EMCRGX_G014106 [Ephydatia muelleri]